MSPMRRALLLWGASRLLLVLAVLAVAAGAGLGAVDHPWADGRWWLDRFSTYDSYHFVRVADEGYFTPTRRCCDQAYFPAYPMLLRALGPILGGPTLAGWVIALLAGFGAAAGLWLVARESLSDKSTRYAVGLLALAPFTVFLVAVYSEALFLAAALFAWWAGLRQQWFLAGVLAGIAVGTRVTGVFLVVGLLVHYLLERRRAGRSALGWDAAWVLLPAGVLLTWMGWLRAQTGSWDAYRQAQAVGWGRESLSPWAALRDQLTDIAAAPDSWLLATRILDLAAVLAGVLLAAVLLWRRRWAEAAYVVPSVAVIVLGSVWESAARYALAWFPAYLLLAEVTQQRPRTRIAVLALSAALASWITVGFALRLWTG